MSEEDSLLAERRHWTAQPRSPERTAALKKVNAKMNSLSRRSASTAGARNRLQHS